MALYSVERTDRVSPGEFMNALVLAGGTALARKAVAHLQGVTAKNVKATLVPQVPHAGPVLLAAYWDEREPEPAAQSETLF